MKRGGRGREATEAEDLVGLGVGWGKPGDSSLYDQYTTELSYRIQLAQNLAATPEVQLIINPALYPDEGVIGVFGHRARVTFRDTGPDLSRLRASPARFVASRNGW